MTIKPHVAFVLLGIMALTLCAGCGTMSRGSAVPEQLRKEAVIPGVPDARIFADSATAELTRLGLESLEREKASLAASGYKGPLPPVSFLAVSGGGDDGAFGAGLLLGWTAAGDRPQFKVVTGISTGALIAPFAFLGPEYDHVLKHVYTNVTKEDIFRSRNLLAVFYKDAMSDTTPLWRLLSQYVDQKMLDAVAAEYQKGRLLLIGTADLDSRRGVIWNMGQIAASGNPKAIHLFKSIMLASAAIPGAFPPFSSTSRQRVMPIRKCTSMAVLLRRFSSILRLSNWDSFRRRAESGAKEGSTSSAMPGWTPNGRKWNVARCPLRKEQSPL